MNKQKQTKELRELENLRRTRDTALLFIEKQKKKEDLNPSIEIPEWLGLAFFFAAIWIDELRWKFFFTGLFFFFIMIMNYISEKKAK